MNKNNYYEYDEDEDDADEVPTKTSKEIENLIEMIDNIDEDVKKNLKNGIRKKSFFFENLLPIPIAILYRLKSSIGFVCFVK